MADKKPRVALSGSERAPLAGAHVVGDVDPKERIEVTISLRPRDATAGAAMALSSRPMAERTYLTRAQLATSRGADPKAVDRVAKFAADHGLEVVAKDAAARRVVLAGSAKSMSAAFQVSLKRYAHAEGSYRGRTGPISIPADLQEVVDGVFGLDDRPQAQPHFRWSPAHPPVTTAAIAPALAAGGYTPVQVAQLYGFGATSNGSGQSIAIIELGGGFRRKDLKAYFGQLGLPLPKVSAVSVDGGRNKPSTPDGADGEVMLDIEVAGAVAPGAKIAVYFAPNTDRGFIDAISAAVHDATRKPSVISISWGGPESAWTAQMMQSMDQAFQDAAAVGITVYCASGDDGSSDRVGDGRAHCDFPASSPHVVACGGTQLLGSKTSITDERTWNDGPGQGASGGGVSDVFPLPSYQAAAKVPPSTNPGHRVGRGVPDLAADASPVSGYAVRVDGQDAVIGGTSAVAPLMAGFTALINAELGKPIGFPNPTLYGLPAKANAFRDITAGNNGAYSARPGWDACTGLGRPNGAALLAALKGTV